MGILCGGLFYWLCAVRKFKYNQEFVPIGFKHIYRVLQNLHIISSSMNMANQ